MPLTEVYFYKYDDGSVPVLDWLLKPQEKNERAARKCFSLIKLLRDLGNELRRPRADLLRDGVYELRTEVGKVNYRMKKNHPMAKITDAVEILKRKMGIRPDTDPEMLQISEGLRVAQMIFDARTEAGLTQKELAQAVGTTQSVISQLESAEYKGHSLTMLERIAKALNRRVEIRLAPRSPVGRTSQTVVPRRLKPVT